jgi:hypothetical protein
MPFQSEKQRRYLWANEPEIARDWTDTYGSGIARALGGRIGLRRGTSGAPGGGDPGMTSDPSGAGQTHSVGGEGPQGPPGGGDPGMTYTAPSTRSRIQDERQEDFRKKQMADLLAQQQAEKDYTRKGMMKVGPQLGLAGSGAGGGLGSWASQFAGSKIGGGLGSMLFGPWGALLGALFGRGVGKRAYSAYQSPEEETPKDILLGQNTLLSNLFSKKKTPTIGGEGIQTIDIRDKFNRLGEDDTYSSIDETINDYDYKPRVRSLQEQFPLREDFLVDTRRRLEGNTGPRTEKVQELLDQGIPMSEIVKSHYADPEYFTGDIESDWTGSQYRL